jgi:hypothetical protein
VSVALYDEYGAEPQSPYINTGIANDPLKEDPGSHSRVSHDPIPLCFVSLPILSREGSAKINVTCSFQMGVGAGERMLPSGTSLKDLG